MRLSSRVSLLVALLFGTVAAFLVRGLIQNMSSDPAASVRTIVVARAPIAIGAPLTAENLREIAWRSTEPLDGSFATVAEVVGGGRRLALATLQRNEPILSARITGPNQRATLSTQLEDGMRAVTVRVDEVRGVAGFVLPGDRVDLILTRGEGGTQDNAYADVLIQNAKVLAVDQIATEGGDKPTIARAVTLELNVHQAQKVVLAQGVGRLSLVLRQANEADAGPTARVTANDLGTAEAGERDRLAEMEKTLAAMRDADTRARAEADRRSAEQLAEIEARMRGDMMRNSTAPVPPGARPAGPSSVVNVIRNGTKSEQYTVSAER